MSESARLAPRTLPIQCVQLTCLDCPTVLCENKSSVNVVVTAEGSQSAGSP